MFTFVYAGLKERYQDSCQSSVAPTLKPTMLSSAAAYPVSVGATPH